jgi:hypothetical protein
MPPCAYPVLLSPACRGNAALRVSRVALAGIGFGQDDDAPGGCECTRRPEARDPAADNDEIR